MVLKVAARTFTSRERRQSGGKTRTIQLGNKRSHFFQCFNLISRPPLSLSSDHFFPGNAITCVQAMFPIQHIKYMGSTEGDPACPLIRIPWIEGRGGCRGEKDREIESGPAIGLRI